MKEIKLFELSQNIVEMIAHQWMLITAGDEKKVNTMTASWGMMGYVWNKPVVNVYVRPQRYTYQFMESQEGFSLCFFDEELKDVLKYCGSHSGKDEDKIAHCQLSTAYQDGIPYFKEASTVILCRKIAVSDLKSEQFLDEEIEKNYPNKDYHRVYTGEVMKVMVKK